MTKEQIITFRDKIAKGMPMQLYGDNNNIYRCNGFSIDPKTKLPDEFIIWDDVGEILYDISRNETTGDNVYPLTIIAATYDSIQNITVRLDYDRLVKVEQNIPNMSADVKSKILKAFSSEIKLSNAMKKSLINKD